MAFWHRFSLIRLTNNHELHYASAFAIPSLVAFHPVRPESFMPQRFKKETYGKKQTNKLLCSRFPCVFQRKTIKIERKKAYWFVVDNCSLLPQCCGIAGMKPKVNYNAMLIWTSCLASPLLASSRGPSFSYQNIMNFLSALITISLII